MQDDKMDKCDFFCKINIQWWDFKKMHIKYISLFNGSVVRTDV